MRSLFWKIFLWFWLAMATVVLAVSAIVFITQQQRFRERDRERDREREQGRSLGRSFNGGPPSRPEDRIVQQALSGHLQTANYLLQKEGVSGLQRYLQNLESKKYLRTFCFDEKGADLLPTSASSGVTAPMFSDFNVAILKNLVQRAAQSSQRETTIHNHYLVAAQRVEIGKSLPQKLILAAVWDSDFNGPDRLNRGPNEGRNGGPNGGPAGRHSPFGPPFGFLWDLLFGEPSTSIQALRLLVILATTGLFCFGLVRHLTTPIFQLRSATKRLAAGDLSARVESQLGHRRDELGILGRDFDQMAERLEDLVAAQNRLIADISHELRSPLARVNVAVELVRNVAGAEAEEDLDRIALETERLNAMIGQLLTISRLESGDPLTQNAPINLAGLLENIAADADFEARGTKRAVRIVQSEACQTRGNESLLRSAIENIVRNAVRYTPENSAVEIRLEKEENCALIRVRDFGIGVPEAALPHLFQPFYRIADDRARSSGGTGLGLSIADRAVRFHNGTLQASNVRDDSSEISGLLLEIRLPLLSA